MDISAIQIVIGGLAGLVFVLAILYQVLPYRFLPNVRPAVAFFPKYKVMVKMPQQILEADDSISALEKLLLVYGFEESGRSKRSTCYIRYSPNSLLYFNINKARIKVYHPSDGVALFKFAAPVMYTYDRGEYFAFLNELKNTLEGYK